MTENQRRSEIAELLSRLPRESPGDDFTKRVLAAYDRREDRSWALNWTPRWSWSMVAILLLVIGFLVGSNFRSTRSGNAIQITQSDQLKARHRALEDELARIRYLSAQTAPVLYLGGEENYDVVFDLSTLIDEQMGREAQPAFVQPASQRIEP